MSNRKTLAQRVEALERENRALRRIVEDTFAENLSAWLQAERRRVIDEVFDDRVAREMKAMQECILDRLQHTTVRVIVETPEPSA